MSLGVVSPERGCSRDETDSHPACTLGGEVAPRGGCLISDLPPTSREVDPGLDAALTSAPGLVGVAGRLRPFLD